MTYDLNNTDFDPSVFKDDILKVATEYDILQYYFPELKFYKANHSPFRNDSVPSFGITNQHGFLYWRDFATGEYGNIWTLVAKKFSTDFSGALSIIARDFGIRHGADFKKIAASIVKVPIPEKKTIELGIRTRQWKLRDKEFWSQFGITKSILEEYLVSPIDYMFFNGHPVKADKLAYVYRELKDEVLTFKIYQPYSEDRKWISNNNLSVWEGWSQLPETGEILIITSSRKDLMTIKALTGIPAVSLQAESMTPKRHVVEELKDRFNHVYVLYDNDYSNPKNPGRTLGKKLADEFELDQIEIAEVYQSKDPSDLCKNKGPKICREVLLDLLIPPF